MGNDEPILAGKRILEKEIEKLQRKLNGPKNTAKHIEAKQNWINRESKRIESESAKLAEMPREPQSTKRNFESGLRGDQDSPRGPAARRRIDGQKTRDTSCLRRTRKKFESLEQQELAFWRGSASKRVAGWTRDGSVEEIAGWMLEAQRLNTEVEAKKRKLQEAIEKESGKDARMGD